MAQTIATPSLCNSFAASAAPMRLAAPPARRPWPVLGLLASMLLLAGVTGCGRSADAQTSGGHGPGGGPPPAMPVAVVTASLSSVPVLLEAVGRAEGSKEVEVHARVTGLIEQQRYREGDRVKANAPLFLIEQAPFEIALAQARATLLQEQARLEQARREAKRLAPLAEQRAISQREYDDSASALRVAEASVAAAQAQVRQAQLNLSYTRVVSPITGITGRAEKSQGSLVSPSDGLLTHVTQTDPIWVRFSFSESELSRLRSGKAGAVKLLSAEGKPLGTSGKLNFEGSTVDPQLGTVQLRAEFANPELVVLPGQFVRAQVNAGEERAFVVPQAAVVNGERGKAVWTIKDGKALPTPVEVGAWVGGDGWAVRTGLNEGDQVIVDNLLKLRPGAPVAPHAASAPGGGASAPAAGGAAAAPAASGAAPASAPASAAAR